jgi:spore maturation protein CgeB
MLLMEPARNLPERRFIVAGPQYPDDIQWPANIARVQHLNPSDHRRFYNQQRFTLNLTRKAMRAAGYSPSIRLFEAGACGVPIISDSWPGLETIFTPGEDILIANTSAEVIECLSEISPEHARQIGQRGRERVLAQHTAKHRARELEAYLENAAAKSSPRTRTNFELNRKETLVL